MAASKAILGINAKCYEAKDFELMIKETKPDIVIVTTTDCFHEKYIVRAMELGCNVISEKPIAIDAGQCQRIADTGTMKLTAMIQVRFRLITITGHRCHIR